MFAVMPFIPRGHRATSPWQARGMQENQRVLLIATARHGQRNGPARGTVGLRMPGRRPWLVPHARAGTA